MNFRTITRKAILISAPGTGKDFLRGSSFDTCNVSNFLMSPQGGCFLPEEIVCFHEARIAQVFDYIQRTKVDYLIIYFTGHGYTNSFTGHRMLNFQDGKIADIRLAVNPCLRVTMIVDACRDYLPQGISGFTNYIGDPCDYFDMPETRELLDDYIAASPWGRVIVHATAKGTSALDSPIGGYFTSTLLHVAKNIRAANEITTAGVPTILSHVRSIFEQRGVKQRPEIVARAGNFQVPFSFGIPVYDYDSPWF